MGVTNRIFTHIWWISTGKCRQIYHTSWVFGMVLVQRVVSKWSEIMSPCSNAARKIASPKFHNSKMIRQVAWIYDSKVVSTHLWNTPLNLYQRAIRDSFHCWVGGLPGVCSRGVFVTFLEWLRIETYLNNFLIACRWVLLQSSYRHTCSGEQSFE